MSETVTILPLGVGDAFSAEHYSCCVAVGVGDRWVLVDCPHPVRKMMREARLKSGVDIDLDRVEAVVLTHLHADHASGLETWAYFCHFALGRRAKVYCHPQVAARLWEGHLAAGMEHMLHADGARTTHTLADWIDVSPLDEARAVDVGPFSVECRLTRHHIPCTALRLAHAGRSLGISADTTFDPELVDWLAKADLFIHEVGYGVHTALDALHALPAAQAARMRLIHYPDGVDTGALEQLREGHALHLSR